MRTYQLHILLKEPSTIQIGKLGIFTFPKGKYIYTGSARKNIESRIKRHRLNSESNSSNKKLHWHIDYFLNNLNTKITNIRLFDVEECHINQQTKGKIIIPEFGSSDCKDSCRSHLKFVS